MQLRAFSSDVFGRGLQNCHCPKKHWMFAAPYVQPRPCSMWLFSVSSPEIGPVGPAFRLLNGRSEEGGGGSEDDVKKCVPARLPGLADTLGQVHTARWGLLWKRPYQVGLCLMYLVSNKFILTLFWLAYVYNVCMDICIYVCIMYVGTNTYMYTHI